MKKKHSNPLKIQIYTLRRQLKAERTAASARAANDRRVIGDLRQQLQAAIGTKCTEIDALINKLHTSAKVMAEQARQESAAVRELQRIGQ